MIQPVQLDHDFATYRQHFETFRSHFLECKRLITPDVFNFKKVHLEIGAGTGHFFATLAEKFPDEMFLAIERDRMRGKALKRKSDKLNLPNFRGYRGNAIPAVFHNIPSESIDSVFILYPCPWPKFSQRKNRWYFHALLPDAIRILKPGGKLIWSSDQEFYIREAEYICRSKYALQVDSHGALKPNAFNFLEFFPEGRTKFEKSFLSEGHPTFELITTKVNVN